MFKREEAARLREEFWTAFGRYMSPVPGAEGGKVNWINYRTGVKDIYFRMEATQSKALICVSIEHKDSDIRNHYFEQFLTLKSMLHTIVGEEWIWEPVVQIASDKICSRTSKELVGVSVYDRSYWPDIISFFKPRMIALDAFWADAKYHFES